jgi:Ca-activated chloride channel family protein
VLSAEEIAKSGVKAEEKKPGDPLVALLSRQLASGLWDESGKDSDDVRRARATARALLELLRAGVTTGHALHGTQVKKAVEALIKLAAKTAASDVQVAEFALGVAWLVSTGRHTRSKIETVIAGHRALDTLRSHLGDERAVRAYVERLAP